jgi:hypothetical protein
MGKPTVYFDTNVLSTMYYHGKNSVILRERMLTWDWWTMERRWFDLYASRWTEYELARGVYRAQAFALAQVNRLRYLPYNKSVRRCAQVYLDQKIVPESAAGDAFQLAFTAVNVIDYLMTWNLAHLARVDTQSRLRELNRKMDWNTPLIVDANIHSQGMLGREYSEET